MHGTYRTAGASIGSLTDGVVTVRDLQTGADLRLTTATPSSAWGDIGSPAWSVDGQRLIYRTGRIEGASLVEIRADMAGAGRPVVPGIMGRLMPDGRTLIFSADERGVGRLSRVVIQPDGRPGAVSALFADDTVPRAGEFDISPDARLIAIVTFRQGLRGDIYIAEIDTPTELFLVQESAGQPRFTGDGRYLYFVRRTDAGEGPEGNLHACRSPSSLASRSARSRGCSQFVREGHRSPATTSRGMARGC